MSDKVQVPDMAALATYLDKARQIATISKMMAPSLLRDLIEGQDVAGMMLARAIQESQRTQARLDQAKAIAYLDKASDYLKLKGLKDNVEARKMYVDLDDSVIQALDDKAKIEALVVLLKNKLNILRMSHDDLKKIVYADTHMTSWEGM